MTVTLLVYPSSWTNPEMETVCGQGVRIIKYFLLYFLYHSIPRLVCTRWAGARCGG